MQPYIPDHNTILSWDFWACLPLLSIDAPFTITLSFYVAFYSLKDLLEYIVK